MDWMIYLLLTVVLSVVGVFLIPVLKEKLGEQRFARLQEYARMAVRAADQLLSDAPGVEKLSYVQQILRQAGFLQETENRAVIEAAVSEQKRQTVSVAEGEN